MPGDDVRDRCSIRPLEALRTTIHVVCAWVVGVFAVCMDRANRLSNENASACARLKAEKQGHDLAPRVFGLCVFTDWIDRDRANRLANENTPASAPP